MSPCPHLREVALADEWNPPTPEPEGFRGYLKKMAYIL